MTLQMDIQVEVPMNRVAWLEFAGLVFDTGIILEDELEGVRRTSLDKIHRYFYEALLTLLKNIDRSYIPFK